VRITGGALRGRVIRAPASLPVRPTTDFAKAALFNILNNYFDFAEIKVLDLFSGAGSIAYEFASRGTSDITCVDQDANCIRFIKKTADEFKIAGITCFRSDVFKFIKQGFDPCDIVFADPPFLLENTDTLPDLILEKRILKENGWLIVEHQAKRVLQSTVRPFDVRKYGNCGFSIYKSDESSTH
jgi:16S rRNA (guanine(966)-N(2))-methyltransferase RsmD